MPASMSFIDHVKDLFSPFGEISVRKMFGGAGIYCDGLFFAIIGDDDIWLKVDNETRATFEDAGLAPFTIEMNGKTGTMSYHAAPEDIYDDQDELSYWVGLALDAARRAAVKKKPKKKPVKKKITKAAVKRKAK